MNIIVDTGFLSSLAKIDRVELPLYFFDVDYLVVPEQVLDELKISPVFEKVLDSIATEKPLDKGKLIHVKEHNLEKSYREFGRGEIACIELCKDEDLILMDDRKAKEFAHKKGKPCFDLPTFLYACNKKEIIDQTDLKEIVEELGEKDYYEFSSEVEKLLLS